LAPALPVAPGAEPASKEKKLVMLKKFTARKELLSRINQIYY
jgi:hypothetical protein